MTTEQHTQPAKEFWTPRWAQSERNWVVLFLLFLTPAMVVPPYIVVMLAYMFWLLLRWALLLQIRYHNIQEVPQQTQRFQLLSQDGRSACTALFLLSLFVALNILHHFDSRLELPFIASFGALWLYVFYSLEFHRFAAKFRSRTSLAIKAAPTASAEPESPASTRIVTATKAFLLLNLGAYLGAALLARAYGLSTGWPGDSETALMVWKGAAIALAMLTAFVLPFLVPYRREHREDHVYLLAVGTLALAIWL